MYLTAVNNLKNPNLTTRSKVKKINAWFTSSMNVVKVVLWAKNLRNGENLAMKWQSFSSILGPLTWRSVWDTYMKRRKSCTQIFISIIGFSEITTRLCLEISGALRTWILSTMKIFHKVKMSIIMMDTLLLKCNLKMVKHANPFHITVIPGN